MNVSGEMHRIGLVLVDNVSDKSRKANVHYLIKESDSSCSVRLTASPYQRLAAVVHANNATLLDPAAPPGRSTWSVPEAEGRTSRH